MQDQTSRALLQQGVQCCYPEREQVKCPRCDSTNTKFCYYNNYNLSQPRHFCKSCRRYWTKGGSLRNIPVGGGTRRKSSSSSSSSSKRASSSKRSGTQQSTSPPTSNYTTARNMGGELGFGSLLAGGQFGGVSEGLELGSGSGSGQVPGLRVGGGEVGQEGCLESGEWGNSNAWPDLAIFTPDSGFH